MYFRGRLPLLLAFAAALSSGAAAQAPPPIVSVAKPVVKRIVEHDDFIGRFAAVDTVDLRARVTGYLARIHFQDGAIVKAGDLLFTIDQRPYADALAEAEANVAAAKASLEFTSGDLDRALALVRSGNISGQITDQRRQSALSAKAALDRSEAVLRRAKLDMEFTEIRAPFGGRISRRLVSIGDLIEANGKPLSTIVSLDPIHFYFDADERSFLTYLRDYVPGATPGKAGSRAVTVTLTGESTPSHDGTIDFLDVQLDPSSGTLRSRAVFPNKDLSLTPGLFGRITLDGSKPYVAVLVPDEAVATNQDRRVVFVVGADNKVAARTVRPGPKIDGYRVIRNGLDGTETLVINGLARVRPGGEVQPKPIELPLTASIPGE